MTKIHKAFLCCALILSSVFCLFACGEIEPKGVYSDYAIVEKYVEYNGYDYTQVHVNFFAELENEEITLTPSSFKIKTSDKTFTASYFVVEEHGREKVVSSLTLETLGTSDSNDSIYLYSENVVLLISGRDLDYNDNFTLFYNNVEIYNN